MKRTNCVRDEGRGGRGGLRGLAKRVFFGLHTTNTLEQ